VQRLDQHLRAQSTSSAELEQLDPGRSNDEIGRLNQSYNELAVRLREANAREREAVLQREAAAAANRMKSDFLANISHELRTPLDSVIGYSELVEEELADRGLESSREDVQRVLESARRISDMIGEIHDLSRIEAGRMPITLSSFDVGRMLQEVIASVEGMARQNGNALNVQLDADLGSAYSDEFRLQQSLVNVLAYCSARMKGGSIELSVRRAREGEHDALHFAMQDCGAALSEHQMQNLFEPFQAFDTSAAFKYGGASLGLAIAGKVIETIGGRIEARGSDAESSTIAIVIPVVAPDHAVATELRLRADADVAA
jgi:signal transduction histidine kinase